MAPGLSYELLISDASSHVLTSVKGEDVTK